MTRRTYELNVGANLMLGLLGCRVNPFFIVFEPIGKQGIEKASKTIKNPRKICKKNANTSKSLFAEIKNVFFISIQTAIQ